jgi:alpha-D-ribose 1-methylphosphonate 5-triphosphate synthase subunit PhnH
LITLNFHVQCPVFDHPAAEAPAVLDPAAAHRDDTRLPSMKEDVPERQTA